MLPADPLICTSELQMKIRYGPESTVEGSFKGLTPRDMGKYKKTH